jgi:hypothetical protein
MKPIRDYSDGQWLLLLWAFIGIFLVTGLAISKLVLVVAILAALGAAYTTFLYVRERIGNSPSGSIFGRATPAAGTGNPPAEDPAPNRPSPGPRSSQTSDADLNEGGTP